MKILILILHFLLISLVSYGQAKPKVVSSASMFTDMTLNIAGDLIDLETIVPVGGDPHMHSPTPKDAKLVAGADLILVNGLSFEGWINELIANSGTKAEVTTITKGVNAILSEEYQGSADPHAWMTAANGRVYARNIKDALVKLDPINTETYEKNFQDYDQKLVVLDQKIKTTIAKIPKEKRVLITSHDAFTYFGNYYGLELEPIVGISTEAEAKTSDITRIGKVIRDKGVDAVFIESTINPKLIKQLASDNGASIGGSLYADSLGDPGTPAGTYIGMMESNTNAIYTGLMSSKEALAANEDKSGSSSYLLYGILAGVFLLSLVLLMKFVSK